MAGFAWSRLLREVGISGACKKINPSVSVNSYLETMKTHKMDWLTRLLPRLLIFGTLFHYALAANAAGPEPAGWYSGDMHVHRSCGGSPETVSSIYNTMVGQNLAVVSLLADMGNGEVQNPTTDLPLVNGKNASVSTSGHLVHWDAEWHWDATYSNYAHQALGGHIVALGLTEAHQIWAEYTYPIFQWAHAQGAIAGFAHLQYLDNNIPQTLNCCLPIEYPVEVALGSCDFVSEDVDGGDSAMQAYYRLLNCGFRPGFAGGSDHPCQASIGSVVTYVQPQGAMSYATWIKGIANGRTVVSRNGHNEFLELKVNNSATPGDEIQLTGSGSVNVSVTWTGLQTLAGMLEIVSNGVVVASIPAAVDPNTPATLTASVDFPKSGWLAARRTSNNGHEVHTAAVFVTVNGAPVRASVTDATFYVAWMDALLKNTSAGGVWNSYFPTSLSVAQARYQAAKAVYQQIALEAAGQQSLAISTTSLPGGVLNASYSATLAGSGGSVPYTWSVSSGSLPPGLALNAASGALTGTPSALGTFSFTVKVGDASTPALVTTKALSIPVASTVAVSSIWSGSAVPGLVDGGADNAVELGVKFRSDVAGNIAGVRFYKAAANTGTHVGNLWTGTGTKLASANFSGESASGWQQVNFAAPVAITANTVYVVSYFANAGHYSADVNYFSATGFDNPPLHALASGVSGGNGVYAYGATSTFPSSTWNTSNYWVDVVFQPAAGATLNAVTLIPASATLSVGASQQFTATGSYSDGSTQNLTSQATWSSSNAAVATVAAGGLATAFASGSTTISAASGGVVGNGQLIVQAAPNQTATTIWQNTTVPATVDGGADKRVELGVKFRSDVAGNITGIRFYKAAANTGTHVGNLWSSTGTKLASATFSGESASGWQQVNFSTPVAIAANTVYVASYHANNGHYSADVNYFSAAGVDHAPLHALANGVSGGNGVYAYATSSIFPTNTWNNANYWVDIVFQAK